MPEMPSFGQMPEYPAMPEMPEPLGPSTMDMPQPPLPSFMQGRYADLDAYRAKVLEESQARREEAMKLMAERRKKILANRFSRPHRYSRPFVHPYSEMLKAPDVPAASPQAAPPTEPVSPDASPAPTAESAPTPVAEAVPVAPAPTAPVAPAPAPSATPATPAHAATAPRGWNRATETQKRRARACGRASFFAREIDHGNPRRVSLSRIHPTPIVENPPPDCGSGPPTKRNAMEVVEAAGPVRERRTDYDRRRPREPRRIRRIARQPPLHASGKAWRSRIERKGSINPT